MDIIGTLVNGLVLVAMFYATKALVGTEIQNLLSKDTSTTTVQG